MKKSIILAVMFCALATPSLAAREVYLKDGGVISARSVWRSGGKVHVLVNRDILTDFFVSEIDVKRTFPRNRSSVVKQGKKSATAGSIQTSAPVGTDKRPHD